MAFRHEAGEIIHDKYKIIDIIASTQTSTVYLARDTRLNKNWALKCIPASSEIKDIALKEAETLKELSHPMIPRITDIFSYGDFIYIVMDYIEGESLDEYMNRGVFREEDVVEICISMLDVMKYLHTQNPPIIHRDIKPSNIIMSDSGRISLIDFGIARQYREDSSSDTQFLGTKGYAAPEQWGGSGIGQTDCRTDIYGLGITMHHMLTGKVPDEPPYEILPLTHYNEGLSSGLSKVVLKASRGNPDKRYQTDSEFIHALEHYHDFDKEALAAWKSKRTKTFICMILSAVFFFSGLYLVWLSSDIKNGSYDSLIARSSSKEAILDAINLYPQREIGYAKLLAILESDFNAENSEEFTGVFESHRTALDPTTENYSTLMFLIGKSYLTKYKADSARENIEMAAPYFSEVRMGKNKLASSYYVTLDSFISEYIVGGESGILGTKEASSREIQNLTDTMLELQKSIASYKEDDRASLIIISNEIIFSVIDSLASEVKDAKDTSSFIKAVSAGKTELERLSITMESLENERLNALEYANGVLAKLNGISSEVQKGGAEGQTAPIAPGVQPEQMQGSPSQGDDSSSVITTDDGIDEEEGIRLEL